MMVANLQQLQQATIANNNNNNNGNGNNYPGNNYNYPISQTVEMTCIAMGQMDPGDFDELPSDEFDDLPLSEEHGLLRGIK
jgi:hypothetical protein